MKDASAYGKQLAHWDGVDLSVDARLRNGLFLQGGVSTGKTMTDNCEIVDDAPELLTAAGVVALRRDWYCHFETPFLPQVQGAGDLHAAVRHPRLGNLAELHPAADRGEQHLQQRQPADRDDAATAVYPRAGQRERHRAGHASTATGSIRSISGSPRSSTSATGRVDLNVDFYNAFNSDGVNVENFAFSPTTWRRPLTVIQPRFVKFQARWDF